MSYVFRRILAPPRCVTLYRSWGLAAGIGAAVGGRVLTQYSGESMFRMGAVLAAATLLLTGGGASLFGKELLGRGVSVEDT